MKGSTFMSTNDSYITALLRGDGEVIQSMIQQELDRGTSPKSILDEGLIRSMSVIGEKFKRSEIYIPEMMISAVAMKAGLETLKPLLISKTEGTGDRILLATVQDDLHDIGKNLVKIIFEGAGFEVIDMGISVSPKAITDAIQEKRPRVVGLSALLTTTMLNMKATAEAIERAGLRGDVKLIIGGAPVTKVYADEIGADAYAADAYSGVEIVNEWFQQGVTQKKVE